MREIHFFEAHTVHADEQGADEQILEDAKMVESILHDLCLPSIVSRRPVWDTFPGAYFTMAADVVMPNGRTLQVATYHHYRDQWAEAFDLKYEDASGESRSCHQTTFGMSERLLGAVVGMHGDDRGLILPPSIAPYQVILMPIAAHKDERVISTVSDVFDDLVNSGIRAKVDDRDVRPGVKHYDWEIRGAPIRIEIGPRDVDSEKCVISTRTGEKFDSKIEGLPSTILNQLGEISNSLRSRANDFIDGLVKPLPALIEDNGELAFESDLEDGLIYELPFDGNDSDAETLEKISGLTLLGECTSEFEKPKKCVITGRPTIRRNHLARMY